MSSKSDHAPLAERLRPQSLGEVIGQQHLLGEGMALRIAFECDQEWRPDNVGEFARLVARDPTFPVATDAVEIIREHLSAASVDALDAFEEAWEDLLEAVR